MSVPTRPPAKTPVNPAHFGSLAETSTSQHETERHEELRAESGRYARLSWHGDDVVHRGIRDPNAEGEDREPNAGELSDLRHT